MGIALAAVLLVALWGSGCRPPGDTGSEGHGTAMETMPVDPPSLAGLPTRWWRPPGVLAVDDALYLGDRWALLDGARGLVHLVDTVGRPVRSVGGRGDGPGELRAPLHLIGREDGFGVLSMGGRLDRFDTAGAFLDRTTLDLAACPLATVRQAAHLRGQLYLAATCTRGRDRSFALLAAGSDGRAEVLRERAALGEGELGFEAPALAPVGEEVVAFAAGDGPCASLVPVPGGGEASAVCLETDPVPLSEPVRRELDRTLGSRARAAGIRLVLPRRFPWLDLLLEGTDGTLIARRPVSATGWTLERLGPPGGSWAVPAGADVLGSHGRIVLVHPGPQGAAVAVLSAGSVPWAHDVPGSPP